MSKERLFELIDQKRKIFADMSDFVFDHPEICFHENESSQYQSAVMEKEGFRITTPVAGMDTAFIAEYGEGGPIIAILGENDALTNQSQIPDYVGAKPIEKGANGHACGHNLLGSGSIEAAVGLKDYLEETGIQATIRYYACPAEEGGGGKVFMAKAGVFEGIDIALCWHPSDDNTLDNTFMACVSFDLTFHGVASHAAGAPWEGRSALDAIELMNMGVNFLREHVTPDTRIHYAYLDAGGSAPNVVQPFAKVRYCIRANKSDYVEEVLNRVIDIAQGACLMTGTTMDDPFVYSAFSDMIQNSTLDKLLLKNLDEQIKNNDFTQEDYDYAAQFQPYFTKPDAESPIDLSIDWNLNKPPRGSSDTGDVSYFVPFGQMRVAACAIGTPGHSWGITSVGKSQLAHKGMHIAAKTLAGVAYDLLDDPALIREAKEVYAKNRGTKPYHSMLPDSVKPGDHHA